MNDSCHLQRATPRDFIAIAALDRVAWRRNANAEFVPDGEHAWRIWCEHALVFVVKDAAGNMAGALLAFPSIQGLYCLHKIMVDERFRGKGIGSQLFDALLAELDVARQDCFLTVDPANENAIKLYQRHGFAPEKLVKGFYRDEEDRIVMVRRTKTVK